METLTKKCNSCNEIKTINNFTIKRSNVDGYFNICKVCVKEKDDKYKKTVNGLIASMYGSQKCRSKKDSIAILYTKQELSEWLTNHEDFEKLYREWTESGYKTERYPSVTKKDTSKPYSLDNIQLRGWRDKLDEDHAKATEKREDTRL